MTNFWQNKNVLVTGGSGFLGRHVVSKINALGPKCVIVPRSIECDLRQYKNCLKATSGVDVVIHLAARVGGIGYNLKNPGSLFYDNLLMGAFMMEAARKNRVGKFVAIGTVCAYPKLTPTPFKEGDLWNGYPEETNAPYGLAKKMLLVQAQAYRKQYGFNAIFLLPVNLYGPGDKFDPRKSHVIPALIKKFCDAKRLELPAVCIWGSGKATREFLYVTDAADGIILASEKYNKEDPVNLGSSFEISISDLARKIAQIVKYEGKIVYDKSKPDGQPRRKLDTTRAYKEFGFKSKINFKKGLNNTIRWYEGNVTKETKET